MKLKSLSIKNFRGVRDSIEIEFDNLTALVGKNDVGKSTLLDALDIFLNGSEASSRLTIDDFNKDALKTEGDSVFVEIACSFCDLPADCILDESEKTTFVEERLCDKGLLKIVRVYGRDSLNKPKTYVEALGADAQNYCKLFTLTIEQLRKQAKALDVGAVKKNLNKTLRSAIRKVLLANGELEVCRLEFSGERLKRLETYLPRFTLFRSDRENESSDAGIQNPLKEVIRSVFENAKIQKSLRNIGRLITESLNKKLLTVLSVLGEYDEQLVSTLIPEIPDPSALKWWDVFKTVTLRDERGISLDKRGSGVRRMVLMSFLQSVAESTLMETDRDVIYAVEEPETAQHADNQILVAESLIRLSRRSRSQVVLTTHSGTFLKEMYGNKIWLLSKKDGNLVVTHSLDGNHQFFIKPLSLVEVSYVLLGDNLRDYHSELYGYIERNGLNLEGWCEKMQKKGFDFMKKFSRKKDKNESWHSVPMYVRDRLHHPENKKYPYPGDEYVRYSVQIMWDYMKDSGEKEYANKAKKGLVS